MKNDKDSKSNNSNNSNDYKNKSFSSDNSDRSYNWSYVLLLSFLKLAIILGKWSYSVWNC